VYHYLLKVNEQDEYQDEIVVAEKKNYLSEILIE
jgi:hypothetical protein